MPFEQPLSFTDHRDEASAHLDKKLHQALEEIALLEKKAERPLLGLSESGQKRLSFLYKEKRRLEEEKKRITESPRASLM